MYKILIIINSIYLLILEPIIISSSINLKIKFFKTKPFKKKLYLKGFGVILTLILKLKSLNLLNLLYYVRLIIPGTSLSNVPFERALELITQ